VCPIHLDDEGMVYKLPPSGAAPDSLDFQSNAMTALAQAA